MVKRKEISLIILANLINYLQIGVRNRGYLISQINIIKKDLESFYPNPFFHYKTSTLDYRMICLDAARYGQYDDVLMKSKANTFNP